MPIDISPADDLITTVQDAVKRELLAVRPILTLILRVFFQNETNWDVGHSVQPESLR